MADESLLVNFDIAPGALPGASRPPPVKGGRWKDRFKAKKQAQHRAKKATKGQDAPEETNAGGNQPRQRIEQTGGKPNSLKRKRQPEDDAVRPNGRHKQQHQQPVISSLFSSNPVTNSDSKAPETTETTPALATNAPLDDGSEFSTLGLAPTLASHLSTKMNMKAPTSIQRAAVPQLISSDSDAFIQAETGSGKTLAYLLPLIHRISSSEEKMHRDSGCFAIILAPTRELGRQIHFVLNQVLSHPSLHWIVPILLLGGEKKKSEKARLRKGGNILVATPGRLADHLENTRSLNVSNVQWFVLDEGDRLMDLGFEATIRKILELLNQKSKGFVKQPALVPQRRVTILCSATIQGNVQRLGEISLSDALFLKAGKAEGEDKQQQKKDEFSAPAQLQQSYVVTPAKLRLVTLAAILKRTFMRQKQNVKVIVFFSCADSVDFHFAAFHHRDDTEDPGKTLLLDPSVHIYKLHGSLKQPVRTATVSSFLRAKGSAVMFCTDIAARGLDLPNVDLVVQYDPPFSKEDYLHRVGRTARAGREGRAMLFVLPGNEERYPTEVLGSMTIGRKHATEVLKLGFTTSTTSGNNNSSSSGNSKSKATVADSGFIPMTSGEPWAEEATRYHLDVERWVLADPENLALARRGFQSFVGAYATHSVPERTIFDIKTLHLGHIAKSFGLRDRPADIKLKSVGEEAGANNDRESSKEAGKNIAEPTAEEAQDIAKRMKMKMKEHMSAISEFNIG